MNLRSSGRRVSDMITLSIHCLYGTALVSEGYRHRDQSVVLFWRRYCERSHDWSWDDTSIDHRGGCSAPLHVHMLEVKSSEDTGPAFNHPNL